MCFGHYHLNARRNALLLLDATFSDCRAMKLPISLPSMAVIII
uniref:MARVEL domain-containing protein n=1 Tax=Parascaris univalens TaxID=6257 RepID=A0A915BR98_PARUN